MSRYNGARVFKSRLFETQGENRKTEITQMEYKNVQGFSLITNSGRVETLQKTTNYDRITAGKIVFDVISGVKGKKISRTAVAKKALLALIRGGHIIWKM